MDWSEAGDLTPSEEEEMVNEFDRKLEKFLDEEVAGYIKTALIGVEVENLAFAGDVPVTAWDAAVAMVRHFYEWHGFGPMPPSNE